LLALIYLAIRRMFALILLRCRGLPYCWQVPASSFAKHSLQSSPVPGRPIVVSLSVILLGYREQFLHQCQVSLSGA
jgi:hypothetical protein